MRVPVAVLALSITSAIVPVVTAQDSPDTLPKVVQHSQLIYPPLARQTRIQGDVHVKIVTDGESVRAAEAETGAPPCFAKRLRTMLETWKFVVHTPGTFHVIFRYKMSDGDGQVEFLGNS